MNEPPHPRRMIPVAKPMLGEREQQLAVEAIQSGWVTQGPRVAQFEEQVAERVEAQHAVAVTSGTAALFLALRALNVGPGDEVIVPSLSFIATANSVVHTGATPVLVDVDPQTYCIDPAEVEKAITPRTRAIMPVDQLGFPADMDRIGEIARQHGLAVVEDAACAIGSTYKGKPVGTSADLVCFSFHARKVIVTGEGGMITTNDASLAETLRLLRHQGMSVSDLERHHAERVIVETYPVIGYNFRMSDILAAIGVAQLQRLDGLLERRREIAARYDAALETIDRLDAPEKPQYGTTNYQSYIVRLCGADRQARDALMDGLMQRGVATRRGLMAIHREPCYRGTRLAGPLVHTDAITDQTLILPMYAELSVEDQEYVIAQLREAIQQ